MPLVHIHLREGKPDKFLQHLSQGIYKALVNSLTTDENPQISNFQTIHQYKEPCFIVDKTIFGVARTDDAVFITVNSIKITNEVKKKLFEEVVNELKDLVRKEDIFINIIELERENWFVGV